MSIELCDTDGHEAASLIGEKIFDRTLIISVGGRVLREVVEVDHVGDGMLVVSFNDDEGEAGIFQFSPGLQSFQESARGNDGEPVCADC